MPSASVVSLRDRRRAETVGEIKDAALRQLSAHGAEGLSLRAVAREVGVTVQALYHYYDSRDALITALVTDAYDALADVVTQATVQARRSRNDPVVAAGLAYRRWAVEHRAAFLLALGVPVADYAAPEGGTTSAAARRMGAAFQEAVFGDWAPEELARLPAPRGVPALTRQLRAVQTAYTLPPGAFAAFTTGWSMLHGAVLVELLGHAPWLGDAGADMCRVTVQRYVAWLDGLRAGR